MEICARLGVPHEAFYLIKNTVQFGGPPEDPYEHISKFSEICNTYMCDDDFTKTFLFRISLKDEVLWWLNSHYTDLIESWEGMSEIFLHYYHIQNSRYEFINFAQLEGESLCEVWERFKDLLRRFPHHGFEKWMLAETFYYGLSDNSKTVVDLANRGVIDFRTSMDEWNSLDSKPRKGVVQEVAEMDEEPKEEPIIPFTQLEKEVTINMQFSDFIVISPKLHIFFHFVGILAMMLNYVMRYHATKDLFHPTNEVLKHRLGVG